MAIVLEFENIATSIGNGATIQHAVTTATGHDYYADEKPNNNPFDFGKQSE